jgi:hypothetical protein
MRAIFNSYFSLPDGDLFGTFWKDLKILKFHVICCRMLPTLNESIWLVTPCCPAPRPPDFNEPPTLIRGTDTCSLEPILWQMTGRIQTKTQQSEWQSFSHAGGINHLTAVPIKCQQYHVLLCSISSCAHIRKELRTNTGNNFRTRHAGASKHEEFTWVYPQ